MSSEDYLPSESEFQRILDEEDPADGASPETVAPDSPSPSVPDPAPERAASGNRGDGRDEKGRFAAKATDADSSGTAAQAVSSTPEAAPATTAQADPTVTGDAPPTTPDDLTDLGPTESLTWRSGDTNWEFPGAVVTKHGIVIPPEHADLLKTALGKASSWDEDRATRNARNAQFRQEQELFKAETAPVMKEIEHVIGLFRTLSQAQTEQHQQQALAQVLEWGLGFVQREPDLRERMAFEKEKRSFELQRELAQPDPEQQQAAFGQAISQVVDGQIQAAKQLPEFKVLTDGDWKELKDWVLQNPTAFVIQQETGPAFNGQQFASLVRREARRASDLERSRQEQQKQVEAARKVTAENAARLNGAKPVTAPEPKKPSSTPKAPSKGYNKDDFAAELRDQMLAALNE